MFAICSPNFNAFYHPDPNNQWPYNPLLEIRLSVNCICFVKHKPVGEAAQCCHGVWMSQHTGLSKKKLEPFLSLLVEIRKSQIAAVNLTSVTIPPPIGFLLKKHDLRLWSSLHFEWILKYLKRQTSKILGQVHPWIKIPVCLVMVGFPQPHSLLPST